VLDFVKILAPMTIASPVAEAGTKPENAATFTTVSERVKTIATWIPANLLLSRGIPQHHSLDSRRLVARVMVDVKIRKADHALECKIDEPLKRGLFLRPVQRPMAFIRKTAMRKVKPTTDRSPVAKESKPAKLVKRLRCLTTRASGGAIWAFQPRC